MKPGLVLSDEQCSKRFGPRKGEAEERASWEAGNNVMEKAGLEEKSEKIIRVERKAAIENEFAVLIDNEKSYEEQNKVGRTLFLSLISTGSVNAQKISEEQLEKFNQNNSRKVVHSSVTLLAFLKYIENNRKVKS